MINSIETERLERLIRDKILRYNKLKEEDTDNKALPYLNSEITFLQESILPIMLCNTTVDYMEMRNFMTSALRNLENHNMSRLTTDLLIHIHLHDPAPAKGHVFALAQTDDAKKMDLHIETEVNLKAAPIFYL